MGYVAYVDGDSVAPAAKAWCDSNAECQGFTLASPTELDDTTEYETHFKQTTAWSASLH